MNPTKDLLKYDPECLYVKKYITELKDENIDNILKNKYSSKCTYPSYIVDLKSSFANFKNIVKDINYL